MVEEELVFLGLKISKKMDELLGQLIKINTHTSKSELVRDSIRRELERRGLLTNKE